MKANKTEQKSKIDPVYWGSSLAIIFALVLGNHFLSEQFSVFLRVLIVISGIVLSLFLGSLTAKGKEAIAFLFEAKIEMDKIIWPKRQEAVQTTLIVFVVVAISALLLLGLDSVFIRLVRFIGDLEF